MESAQKLSPRELETLMWAARGKTYWETARILGIGYASVHSHVNSLKLKMNAVSMTHAVALAYELGILELRTAEPRPPMAASSAIVPELDWSAL